MLPYLTLLAVAFTLAYYVQTQQRVSNQNLIRKAHTQDGRWVLVIMTGILVLFAGLRHWVGSDFGVYRWFYTDICNHASLWETLFLEEEGLFWGMAVVLNYVTPDPTLFFLISSALIIIPIVKLISKYSINFSLSIFLYLTMMDYFSSFNGIRQWIASAILFAGLPLLLDGKKGKYALLILLAYFFHNSAVIMLPVMFTLFWNPKSSKTYVLLLLIFAFFFIFPSQTNALLEWIAPDNYKKYFDTEGDDGVNLLRVLVAAIPVILTRIYYKNITEDKQEKPFIDVLINFSTLNFMIMVLGLRNTTMARLGMYFSTYNVLLIPYLIRVFKEESRLTAKVMIMACFFVYFYLLLPVDAELLPYRSVLDNLL